MTYEKTIDLDDMNGLQAAKLSIDKLWEAMVENDVTTGTVELEGTEGERTVITLTVEMRA